MVLLLISSIMKNDFLGRIYLLEKGMACRITTFGLKNPKFFAFEQVGNRAI
jgi:hypothetical protein